MNDSRVLALGKASAGLLAVLLLAFVSLLPGGVACVEAQPARESGAGEEEEKTPDQRLLLYLLKPVVGRYAVEEAPRDLRLGEFFTYGWTVGWEEPDEGPNDAPRFRLLRIKQAFFERELRYAHTYTSGADDGAADEQEGEFELELPISRRLLIEFEGGFVGLKPDGESWKVRGGDLKVIPEVMLIGTRDVSFSSGLEVRTPTGARSVGEGRTSLTPYLAVWKDMGWRIGLHNHVGMEFPLGGFESGAPDAVLQYGVAPAVTVTPKKTPYFGNCTFFFETNGETSFGGEDDQTTLALLPGARWLLFKDFWVAGGYEFTVAGTDEFDNRIWASLYRDF